MSNDRTNVSVKRDHIKLMNTLFRYDAVAGKYVAQPKTFFSTPDIVVDMGNFIGALNKADSEQYPATPPAPPVPDTPLSRFDSAPSNWAAWRFVTATEIDALLVRYPMYHDRVNGLVNFYTGGGGGGMGVAGFHRAGNEYVFFQVVDGHELLTNDVNGAADEYIVKMCAAQGRPIPYSLR